MLKQDRQQTSVFNKKKETPEDDFVYEYPMGYPVMALIWGPIFSIIIGLLLCPARRSSQIDAGTVAAGGVLTFCGFVRHKQRAQIMRPYLTS